MTVELATKGIVCSKCQLLSAEEIAIATRDEILTDATKFAGANIDAKISSRATPGDVSISPLAAVVVAVAAVGLSSNAPPSGNQRRSLNLSRTSRRYIK